MRFQSDESEFLNLSLFENPSAQYRGVPFWAWNCQLKNEVLDEQIEMFKKMGMGGFHIHVRTGLEVPYLGDEYMDAVCHCIKKAKQEQLFVWLYDEDRWPSGSAGGIVTRQCPSARACNLMLTPTPYGQAGEIIHRREKERGRGGKREENGYLLCCYDIVLDNQGSLQSYKRVSANDRVNGTKWYAYVEYVPESPWFNNSCYVDMLNPDAVSTFIAMTHEKYNKAVGEEFGAAIPAIFTDEPGPTRKYPLHFALGRQDVFMPWTQSLPEKYELHYHENLLDKIPELFWECPGSASGVRWRFHNLIATLFTDAFSRQIGEWCRQHNLMMAGHFPHEGTLHEQTMETGDVMRGYYSFSQLPGIDILYGKYEYNTLKQAQSAKHQLGTKSMLSELYGVSGWDYSFRDFKLQGDWQAALGVTVRVPHLTWMSMKGEAKRDFPACIGCQSPWWKQFSLIEDHFARLNTVLTRGKPIVHLAVLHPIESYWTLFGPDDKTAAIREEMDARFASLTEILLFGQINFDFINESQFPMLCPAGENPLKVGSMCYDTVLVPPLQTIRSSTIERLSEFKRAGGKLIFLEKCPPMVNAQPDTSVQSLYDAAVHIPFNAADILNALQDIREVDISMPSGHRCDFLIHQLREDGDTKWLFVARGKKPISDDVDESETIILSLQGEYIPTVYNTMTGETSPLEATYQNQWTTLMCQWHLHDSMLLRLDKGKSDRKISNTFQCKKIDLPLFRQAEIKLEEPNVFLLDRAQWALDDSSFHDEEEILRIDNLCCDCLGFPRKSRNVAQPYTVHEEKATHTVSLRFHIDSTIPLEHAHLALENAQNAKIFLNDAFVPSQTDGFYVDKAIKTVMLPNLVSGENELLIKVPFGRRTSLEWCYLLGTFGVKISGVMKTITPFPQKIGFGSIVHQGFPFYTGNYTYLMQVQCSGKISIRIAKFRGALIQVSVDDEFAGTIAFAPYCVTTGVLQEGCHTIAAKVFGTRQNGFGQLHHEQSVAFYQSPDSWRSDGDLWLDEYQLHPEGILKSPELSLLV